MLKRVESGWLRHSRGLWLTLAAFTVFMSVPATHAQPLLSCGAPVVQRLNAGAVDTYRFQLTAGSAVSVDVRDDMGVLGLIKLRSTGPGGTQETCTGTIMLSAPGESQIEVSDCIGSDSGDYTITASVVAAAAANCGIPLPCGTLTSVFDLALPGEVDSFVFTGAAGEVVTLRATDLSGTIGFVRQRVFDPDGVLVSGTDSCATATRVVQLQKSGVHTLLVSACGLPQTGSYGLSSERPSCPQGPEITYFGLARADGRPAIPNSHDAFGRSVFKPIVGSGFYIVLEAAPHNNGGAAVGRDAYQYDEFNPAVLPDLQVLFSQQLGNGSGAVCDKTFGMQGGVPATESLEFVQTPAVSNAINDFGCRVDNGGGSAEAVSEQDACTQFSDGSFHFVQRGVSSLQFCAPIAAAWAFSRGTTIVRARVRDLGGVVGAEREIVVQVGDSVETPRPTATPTPTGTPVLTPTRLATATPSRTPHEGQCVCDCDGDYIVTIDEIVTGMTILMGLSPLDVCAVADTSGDSVVTVDEIVQAVNAALGGCP